MKSCERGEYTGAPVHKCAKQTFFSLIAVLLHYQLSYRILPFIIQSGIWLLVVSRWRGVGVVSVGLLLIGGAHVLVKLGSESGRDHTIGNCLIIGQSIMSVLQDITEETFMHETDFPATLLLGMEGLYGLLFFGIINLIVAPFLPADSGSAIQGNMPPAIVAFSFGLTLWVTLTGIFNILATQATSSMTRNVWKNSRTLLVWCLGLLLFYCTGNVDLGEQWLIPESFLFLVGYLVMVCGIYLYYRE
jgi:hypothetical protein